ncbi:aminoglycoside phosphotransferase [Dinoroseobacter shibae DFL 12 = DSM 16493]|jgi:aminoglycoside phosphotransferase (APT) family kinase protein|uniref:Aminoglycoside phosphotransferase n=1 Tax=Dinoroseobacter shibae (strain DSM 16493 / NCIMB 14021 / DFL 12) TaxID=398580 RepID=A8LSD1_DINSH|nr:phosphotransferase family protein [Dinoroseobacter shibae]ABV92745.1 aminoglycoside phosphotransferase [Dinoroseobacter shibae DFL 12 = DSM 16493]URF47688.1 phosphotransferase family protein [Dinoroseobacter shibae]URF51998.1 phosphotransferase family protein [Dinoroseobacter shibae]
MSPEIDREALRRWCDARFGVADAAPEVARIGGGQSNPTFYVTHGDRRLVLRKQPPGPLLKGAHAVDREFRVLRALWDTPVPVPEALAFEPDAAVLGTPFYVMARLEGRVCPSYALPELARADRGAALLSMAETLARLHAVNPEAVGLGDYGRPGDYFARQMARWSAQYDASPAQVPDLDALRDWLAAHMPEDDGAVAIAHGDFRMGNMMLHPTEPRVIAVLDWELSTLGHPLADLGFACMAWHSAPEEYGGLLGLDLAAEGLPEMDAFVAAYRAAAQGDAVLRPFHVAFAMFRFAVIFVGIADRAAAGSAAGADAARLAPLAEAFARRGLAVSRLDF